MAVKKTVKITLLMISLFAVAVLICTLLVFKPHQNQQFSGLGDVFLKRQGAEGPYANPVYYHQKRRPPLAETRHMPHYVMRFSTALSDNGSLRLTLDIKFDEISGVKGLKARSDRILYALKLSLQNNPSVMYTDAENRVYDTVVEILRTRLQTAPRYIYITRYTVTGPSQS